MLDFQPSVLLVQDLKGHTPVGFEYDGMVCTRTLSDIHPCHFNNDPLGIPDLRFLDPTHSSLVIPHTEISVFLSLDGQRIVAGSLQYGL
jgi:hypothetical protein